MPQKTCYTCGYRDLHPTVCQLIKCRYSDSAACPYYTPELIYCDCCNSIIPKHAIVTKASDNTYEVLCDECAKLSGTCGDCSNALTCAFDTDPSPLPKAVQKRIQQGPQTIITQVRNPSRIDITCRKGCPCFDAENDLCSREYSTCRNYCSQFDNS